MLPDLVPILEDERMVKIMHDVDAFLQDVLGFPADQFIIIFLEHIKAGPEGGADASLEDVDEDKVEKNKTQEQDVSLAQAKTWKNLGLYFINFFFVHKPVKSL